MFNSEDFRQIINNTTDLLDQIKTASPDDAEELQLRIDSNIHALQIVGAKITDPELRQQAERIIRTLHKNAVFEDGERAVTEIRHRAGRERSDLIANELYRGTLELKEMARGFSESLKVDGEVLRSATDKMTRNSTESHQNIRALEDSGKGVKTTTYLCLALIIFFMMYLVIRFL